MAAKAWSGCRLWLQRTRASSGVLLSLLLFAAFPVAGTRRVSDTSSDDARGPLLPLVMLVDVYDTTFLVGSKHRCSPSCTRGGGDDDGGDDECAKDLNNDDVTRFGLGQRPQFGVVRDAGCPYPHLTAAGAAHTGSNRVAAVVLTDFSLDVAFDSAGAGLLDASDVGEAGEALDYSSAVRAAWIVEVRL